MGGPRARVAEKASSEHGAAQQRQVLTRFQSDPLVGHRPGHRPRHVHACGLGARAPIWSRAALAPLSGSGAHTRRLDIHDHAAKSACQGCVVKACRSPFSRWERGSAWQPECHRAIVVD
eukprot:15457356-Alexandrium_andersonii.AAC.1